DGENLDKMKEKGDMCIMVGYSNQSKGYRVYNKRTRLIVESIHIRFDEIKEVSETSVANDTSGLPEWSRFVMIVKQQHKLDEVSYHKFFDILKQYQKEVKGLHAERFARNANPLALVTTAQRTMNVAGARENIGSPVVQQSRIQCFNCKEFDTDEEIDEQELEAHYSYMAKIEEVPTAKSGTDSEPLEQ
nr:integrase, catalytic region, zinc finger, CCHC-type, peptidase aspartic, catalytic [Tanacetum cinerariifolium]